MAKAYKAVTIIDGGRQGKGGSGDVEKYYFEPGDVVKGLTKEEMRHLWDQGALEAVDVVEVERESKEETGDGIEGSGRKPEPTQE